MPALTPPQDGDANRGPALLAIIGTQVAISTICVSLRFYTRIKIGRVGADDWTIMVTLAMYITLLPLCIVQVHYGLGRHIYYITAVHQIEMMKLTWIMQLINSLNLPIGRVSVVLLLERLMGRTTTWRRLFLWVNMTLFTASMIASSILSVAQCSPPRALWSEVPEAVCLDLSIHANFATFACAYSSFLDFVLALTPITFVRKLEMSIHKKIGICILLGMGMLSGICAAIKTDAIHAILYKTTQLSKLRADLPWEFFSTYAWSS
ncbi:hypothetical protein F4819DRAFT_486339 [Hypoxylon fuscum]|nr:hypothetical protein F4819DRAFT_486339 [Hypoxylon fuscum]